MRSTIQWLEKNRSGKKLELYKAFLEPKERALYDYLVGESSLKVADVSQVIFGGSYKAFREAKDNLEDGFADLVITTSRSISKQKQNNKLFFFSYKMMIALRFLSAQSAIRWEDRNHIKKLADIFSKHGLVLPALEILRVYRMKLLNGDRNLKEVKTVSVTIDSLLSSFLAFYRFEFFYQKIALYIKSWNINIKSTLNEINNCSRDVLDTLNNTPNVFLMTLYYGVLGLKALIERDYRIAIVTIEEGISRVNSSRVKNLGGVALFFQVGLVAAIKLGNRSLSLSVLHKTDSQILKTDAKTTKSQLFPLMIKLCLRLGLHEQGITYLRRLVHTKGDSRVNNFASEDYPILSAYFYFLYKIGKLDGLDVPTEFKRDRYRLGKFMNDVPIFSKDKAGTNISILIAQAIILLVEKRYEEFSKRVKALETYRYRHLNKNDMLQRGKVFIKMLELIPRADFHRERVVWRSRELRKQLDIPPEKMSIRNSDIEVIPYEHLWEYIVDLLDNKLVKSV